MKVLIFGASGMLGHKVFQVISQHHETWGTIRNKLEQWKNVPFLFSGNIIENINITDNRGIYKAVDTAQPDVIINCLGIIKQLKESENPVDLIAVNALFPNVLAKYCQIHDIRLIHISTDCVFSGKKGDYTEEEFSDAYDLYGRTKLLGEVSGDNCLTLRTSIIGRELKRSTGLVEWFLSQQSKKIKGFKNAVFSGFITKELSEIILNIINNHPKLCGLYHISSDPIDKFSLLNMIKESLNFDVEIEEDTEFHCNRSLNSVMLRDILNYNPPLWPDMIKILCDEIEIYKEWRK